MSKLKNKTRLKNNHRKNFWQYSINHQLKKTLEEQPHLKNWLHYRFFNGYFIYDVKSLSRLWHRHNKTISQLKWENKRDKCKEEFIKALDLLSQCGREYALLEWEAIEDDGYLDFDNFNAEDTVREVISNWSF